MRTTSVPAFFVHTFRPSPVASYSYSAHTLLTQGHGAGSKWLEVFLKAHPWDSMTQCYFNFTGYFNTWEMLLAIYHLQLAGGSTELAGT